MLSDKNNRIIGVEIEPDVFDNQPEGPLQAIKYRYMLEWATNRAKGDSRSMLIARSVSRKMKDRCKDYGIEVYELKLSELESIHDA